MANGLKDVIKQLEQQRTAIERALVALREVDAPVMDGALSEQAPSARGSKGKRKGGMTPEGRKRLSEALRKRWAAKRAGQNQSESSGAGVKARAVRKGGMTPEGRKRLSEALRKRWAAKRAGEGAATKRGGRK